MAYVAPYIDSTGLHIPTYNDLRDHIISEVRSVFGTDIYLDNDSMDYQLISILSLKIYDTYLAIQLAYNNRGPATSIGAGLDSIVKLNGIRRKSDTFSSCPVIITGDAGTTILNGSIVDQNNNVWNLPARVDIPDGGSISVSAVCTISGPVVALANTLNKINSPTKGWISVNNAVPAVLGQTAETDSQLRARQAVSTALPSQALLDGTSAGVISVPGVLRSRVYENDTNVVDANGLPPHSITAVVEGGSDTDIAQQIYLRKGVGGYTNGDVVVPILDSFGVPTNIRFFRPTYVSTFVDIKIRKLSGYILGTDSQIVDGVVNSIKGCDIGQDVSYLTLLGIVSSYNTNQKIPLFSFVSLTLGKSLDSLSPADLDIGIKELATTDSSKVIVTILT